MKNKTITFMLSSIIIISLWIIVPLIIVRLNTLLNLPIFYYLVSRVLGVIIFMTGLVLTLYIVRGHLITGRITPVAVEPPKEFIVEGFYKYTRNPMYIAILITFFGGFLILGHFLLLIYVLLAFPAFHLFVIYKEEPELEKLFGKKYLKYKKEVPRWLPKLRNLS